MGMFVMVVEAKSKCCWTSTFNLEARYRPARTLWTSLLNTDESCTHTKQTKNKHIFNRFFNTVHVINNTMASVIRHLLLLTCFKSSVKNIFLIFNHIKCYNSFQSCLVWLKAQNSDNFFSFLRKSQWEVIFIYSRNEEIDATSFFCRSETRVSSPWG